jgi:hypothetical protein
LGLAVLAGLTGSTLGTDSDETARGIKLEHVSVSRLFSVR